MLVWECVPMYRIALCDDDPEFLAQLQLLVEKQTQEIGLLCEITGYADPAILLSDFHEHSGRYSAVFLDIEMPGQSGIELAECIRQKDKDVLLLFITTYEEYVYRSFEVEAFRYIPKRKLDEYLPGAIRTIKLKLDRQALLTPLGLKTTKGELVYIRTADLLYIQKNGKNCIYHKAEEEFAVRQPISTVQGWTADQPYVMINSGCLVNIQHVHKVDKSDVVLTNGHQLPISRLRLKEVKMAIHLHWSKDL